MDKIITLDEKKKIMLEMLSELDKFCISNKITYFLTGGTLLGAIRHNGYIPWDDDIDICLMRKDCDKLVSSFKSTSGNISILDISNTEGYIWPSAKAVDKRTILIENKYKLEAMGVYIDIFPMDNLPGDIEQAKKYALRVKKVKDKLTLKHLRVEKDRAVLKNIVIILGKILYLIPDRCLIRKIEKLSRKYQNEKTEYICNLSGAWGIREITRAEFFSATQQHIFENKEFSIPVGYDGYLKNVYGDYMTPPSKEKQITHHASEEFWRG